MDLRIWLLVPLVIYFVVEWALNHYAPRTASPALLYDKKRRVGYRCRVYYRAVFRLKSGQEKSFSITDAEYFSLPEPGYRGELIYQRNLFRSFAPYRDQEPGKLPGDWPDSLAE